VCCLNTPQRKRFTSPSSHKNRAYPGSRPTASVPCSSDERFLGFPGPGVLYNAHPGNPAGKGDHRPGTGAA
jgi:hypothetical protein